MSGAFQFVKGAKMRRHFDWRPDMMTRLRPLPLILFALLLASPVLAQQGARKFDEMGEANCEDAKARLDHLAIELQNNPTDRAYIIFYGGKSYGDSVYSKKRRRYVNVRLLPQRGEAQTRIRPWKPYLADSRGIDGSRIEVIDGGYREKPAVEFWIVPAGAKPPAPTPTLKESDIKFRRGDPNKRVFFSDC